MKGGGTSQGQSDIPCEGPRQTVSTLKKDVERGPRAKGVGASGSWKRQGN